MIVDDAEYVYGEYPYDTDADKSRVACIAEKIREERRCGVYIHRKGAYMVKEPSEMTVEEILAEHNSHGTEFDVNNGEIRRNVKERI